MTAPLPPIETPPVAPPPAAPAVDYGVAAADAPPRRRGVRFPAWLAVFIVALAAGGFAYLGWRLLKPPPPVDLSQYDTNDTGRAGGFARPAGPRVNAPRNNPTRTGPVAAAPRPDGVTIDPDGNGTVVAGGLSVRFITTAGKQNLIATASPGMGGAPEDRNVVRARAIATNDNAKAKAAGLTDDQIKFLRGTQLTRPQPIDAATRTKLLDLWGKLRAADAAGKAALQTTILDAVRAAAAAHTAADTASYHAYAEQVRRIINAAQVTKLRAN